MRADEPPQYLSTPQAAEVLGVSVSTIKRWVDEGVLPAHKTPGGHRKLTRADVLALARSGDLPRGDLAALGGARSGRRPADPGATANALFEALMQGEGSLVNAVISGAYRAGFSVEAIADQIVAPTMTRVGHDWETRRIDVWHEHRATQLCSAALYDLKDELELRAERNRPVAVGGAPEGDPYLLPSLLAQLVLLDAGWDAVNLGPNTPLSSLIAALRELRPRLLWLSVTHIENTPRFVHACRDLCQAAEQAGVAVAVGGQALTDAVRSTIPYTAYGDRLHSLGAFARTLHPRPRRPRRGRPPST
ncbi:MAG TPA: helix-turn-helix domain-containing protein [Planctomycetaceae bacterium]|nr:helix-turn-helix domain-containing protein [Planctomycetaceae bacterium]